MFTTAETVPEGLIRLRHAGDARLSGFRHLVEPERRRDIDRMEGVFVVEGVRAIRQALDHGWPLRSVLLSDTRAVHRPDLVADALAAGAAVYSAGRDVIDGIAGYPVHRGALALAVRPAHRTVQEVMEGRRLLLVVEGVNDHENLGALFRNAAAFGVQGVILDSSAADPLYRRSVRVSVGHVLDVPFARSEPSGAWLGDLHSLRRSDFRLLALTPAGEVTLDQAAARAAGSARALMVGAEDKGLTRAALDAADFTVRIPMAAGVDSLNVATSAAVALSRLSHLPPLLS